MANTNRSIFLGLQILVKNAWLQHHAVVVEDKLIKAILPVELLHQHLPAKTYEFPANYYLVPGFIDLHIHGTNGFDVMDGNIESLVNMGKSLAEEGVTGFLATTMTANKEHMDVVLNSIGAAISCKENTGILGAHLEGPFISREKAGAQQQNDIEKPDIPLMEHWQKMAHGAIKLVTLAPEISYADNLIKKLREMGITASAGHTNATYDNMQKAFHLGCTHAAHLFNAMRGLHHREPGAAGALLLEKNVSVEIIADGLHVHPAMIDLAFRLKGADKFVLVTDAMCAKCLGDGEYKLGGQSVTVCGNKAFLNDGTLAGSVLSMPQAIKNILEFTHCSLADAVNMASANPASVIGLSHQKGSIEQGKHADLVVLDDSWSVVMTMREGLMIKDVQTQDAVYDAARE